MNTFATPDDSTVALIVAANVRKLDDVELARALPHPSIRSVGPFVFFDHFGPSQLPPMRGLDVRPHPHIHLATVTYLFAGEILHRDSLGSVQSIRPGAINWMTAGRGIVHSERTPPELRRDGVEMHGVQLWLALPLTHEDVEPSFVHHPAASIPEIRSAPEIHGDVRLRVLAGTAFGHTSPVAILSPLFYVEALLGAGAKLILPADYAERGVYVVSGEVRCGANTLVPHHLAILRSDVAAEIVSVSPARVMLLGGAPLDAPRTLWWNFVSSSKQRIVEASEAWRAGTFPKVPGDDVEFIPLNDAPPFAND